MHYLKWLTVVGWVLYLAAGCRSTKKIQTVITKKDTVQVMPVISNGADSMQFIRDVFGKIQDNRIQFHTFSAKVKVDFEGSDGKKSDFNAFIRLKKDSILWVSINAALGIEAFRLMVTPDSVKVMNKLDKVIQLRSVEYLQEMTKIPLSFTELQELLIGNPLYLDSNITSYKRDEKSVSLISIGTLFKHLLTVSNGEYLLMHSKLDDVDVIRARTADITYGDYETKNNILFSTYRRIIVSEKTRLDITLQFKQFEFNADLGFPFNIPRNYKYQ